MPSFTTELQAINSVLRAAGQAPINSIELSRADVRIAQDLIDEVSRDLQTDGWNFNIEKDLVLQKDGDGKIAVPTNLVRFVLTENVTEYKITIRNGYLYDTIEKTDVFTQDLTGDAVYILEFSDLPQAARQYITAKAARLYLAHQVGDRQLTEAALREEQIAHQKFINHETDTARYTIFENNPARATNRYRYFRR